MLGVKPSAHKSHYSTSTEISSSCLIFEQDYKFPAGVDQRQPIKFDATCAINDYKDRKWIISAECKGHAAFFSRFHYRQCTDEVWQALKVTASFVTERFEYAVRVKSLT